MRFDYELRPDAATYSTGRTLRHIKYRLRSVEVRMDDHLVRAYALAYDLSSSTGRSVLRSVQQFPSDASVAADGTVSADKDKTAPLPPVTFDTALTGLPDPTWQLADFSAPLAASLALPASPRTFPDVHATVPGDIRSPRFGGDESQVDDLERTPLYGDFDGDSRVDAASWLVTSGCSPIKVRLAARPAGPLAVTPAAGCGPTGYITDVNGDGFDDLLVMGAGWHPPPGAVEGRRHVHLLCSGGGHRRRSTSECAVDRFWREPPLRGQRLRR